MRAGSWLRKSFMTRNCISVSSSHSSIEVLRPEWGMQCIIELNHEVNTTVHLHWVLNIVISLGLKKNNNVRIIYIFRCKQNFALQNITSLFLLLCNFRKPRDHVFLDFFWTGSTIWWSVYILMLTFLMVINSVHRAVWRMK